MAPDPDAPDKHVLERPWARVDEEVNCTGSTEMPFELTSRGVMLSSPGVVDIACHGGKWGIIGSATYCGGPYEWLVHKRATESVTLMLPWKGKAEPGVDRNKYQTWYLEESACEKHRRVRRRGGCG